MNKPNYIEAKLQEFRKEFEGEVSSRVFALLNIFLEQALEEQAAGFEQGLKEINQFKKKLEKEIEYLREAQKTQETDANKAYFAKDIGIYTGMVEGLFHAEDIMKRAGEQLKGMRGNSK